MSNVFSRKTGEYIRAIAVAPAIAIAIAIAPAIAPAIAVPERPCTTFN
jgi:hypothetical protein